MLKLFSPSATRLAEEITFSQHNQDSIEKVNTGTLKVKAGKVSAFVGHALNKRVNQESA